MFEAPTKDVHEASPHPPGDYTVTFPFPSSFPSFSGPTFPRLLFVGREYSSAHLRGILESAPEPGRTDERPGTWGSRQRLACGAPAEGGIDRGRGGCARDEVMGLKCHA